MPRPRSGEPTRLGQAIRAQRGEVSLEAIAAELDVSHTTLSRLERGTHRPSAATARTLARRLGWTVEQVLDAAEQPVPSESLA